MPLLSIIIPVFNCAAVITRCLKSIDYSDAEILVIDDGSTDATAKIASEYAQSHPNVRLIHKDNGGVSSARNLGIESASGKYIMFIDADDYIVPGGISRIIELAEKYNAEVVKYKIVSVKNNEPIDTSPINDYPITYQLEIEEMGALLIDRVPDYHVVDAIFLLAPILQNGIRFQTQLSLREDDVFCGMLFCHIKKLIITDLPLYRYVRCSDFSSTHNQTIEKQRTLIGCSYLAMSLRGSYVNSHCPQAIPSERIKYMRWVCRPKTAFEAGYSLKEYRVILAKYKQWDCWPIDYNWVHVAGLDWSWKIRIKNWIKTFLCNHPGIAYVLLNLKSACTSKTTQKYVY